MRIMDNHILFVIKLLISKNIKMVFFFIEPSKFLIPNDIALNEMLDLFGTDEAKTIVTDWFRFKRTV